NMAHKSAQSVYLRNAFAASFFEQTGYAIIIRLHVEFAILVLIKRSRLNWVRFGDPYSHMGAPVPAFIRTILSRWRRLGAVGPKRMSGHELKNRLLAARRWGSNGAHRLTHKNEAVEAFERRAADA